jgi:hypothetical protein
MIMNGESIGNGKEAIISYFEVTVTLLFWRD